MIEQSDEYTKHLNEWMYTQYCMKKGLQNFRDEDKCSIIKELDNITFCDVFVEAAYESLTLQQKKWTLPILLFTMMKCNGTLKSRFCADSLQQRLRINKEDVSSPTPIIEVLKFTLIVDT